uniref:Secreted protein n=1 Tax=Heterorhabditis bacteriophora TaxID=37862 RepID=A0A1I7XW82_HETBA
MSMPSLSWRRPKKHLPTSIVPPPCFTLALWRNHSPTGHQKRNATSFYKWTLILSVFFGKVQSGYPLLFAMGGFFVGRHPLGSVSTR